MRIMIFIWTIATAFIFACSSQNINNNKLDLIKRQYRDSVRYDRQISDITIDLSFYQVNDTGRIAEKINNNIKSTVFTKIGVPENTDSLNYQAYYNKIVDEYKELSQNFPNSATIGFEQQTRSEISCNNGNILSVYMESYLYTGGAHGMEYHEFLNFDPNTGDQIDIVSRLQNNSRFLTIAEKKLREKLNMDENDPWADHTFLKQFKLPQNIGITPEGYRLIYNSYEILPYSEGHTDLFIDFDEVRN